MKITRFDPAHVQGCLEVFSSNEGRFFDRSELAMFTAFLKNEGLTKEFFMISEEEVILGCGGFLLSSAREVELIWGMVHRSHHHKGYGAALLAFRLDRIRELFGPIIVRIETSQHTEGFFAKYGFVAKSRKPDGYGPGIDRVLMTRSGEPVAGGEAAR